MKSLRVVNFHTCRVKAPITNHSRDFLPSLEKYNVVIEMRRIAISFGDFVLQIEVIMDF